MSSQTPTPLQIQPRQPSDLAGTVRFTDASGGAFKQRAQSYYREELEPLVFDSYNIDAWSRPGQWFLTPKVNVFGAVAGTDKEYLPYTAGNAVVWLPTAAAGTVAADITRTTEPTGVPTRAAIGTAYPGALPIRNAVVWRNLLVVAAGEVGANALRTMVLPNGAWASIAAVAPAPTTAACQQVGIGPDDKLYAWFKDTGIFSYDATAWVKVFPPGANAVPVEGDCDMLMDALGSTIFALRDASDITSLWEFSIESTGTLMIRHLHEFGMRFWPQGLDVFNGAAWFVARMGPRQQKGILFRKEKLAAPEPMMVFDTNLQGGLANNGRGLDWAVRSVRALGDVLYIGGSHRTTHEACVFRVTEDENGMILHPAYVLPGVDGPVYGMAVLPFSAAGVAGTDRLFLSVKSRTCYKDADDDVDPTLDADEGWIQFPDVDYGAEDRSKTGRFVEGVLLEKGVGATDQFQYRIDPPTPSTGWTTLGDFNTVASPTTPPDRLPLGHDNEAQGIYGRHFRKIQPRVRMTRAQSGSVRSRMDTVAIDVVEMRPPGQ